ncbi:hypothetical protein [Pseudarthrobacter sp. NPDC080039]|uniref:hypothetical protein n=1 Tax=unclassified Pseudarthrobacter TaxID=2647000 RepID=UPI00344B9857
MTVSAHTYSSREARKEKTAAVARVGRARGQVEAPEFAAISCTVDGHRFVQFAGRASKKARSRKVMKVIWPAVLKNTNPSGA